MIHYKGFDKNGKKITGNIDVETIEEAKIFLHSKKIVPVKIYKKKHLKLLKTKINTKDFVSILLKLSVYLENGVELFTAINLLKKQTIKDKQLQEFFSQILHKLRKGNSFYISLIDQDVFLLPENILQSIKVAEENGFLAKMLKDNAILIENQQENISKIKSALTYPSFIVFVAIGMIFFMLTNVVPKIVSMYQNNNQELPKITKIIISISEFLKENTIVIVLLFLIITLLHLTLLKTNFKYKKTIHGFLLFIPFVKEVQLRSNLSQFSETFATLLENGISYSMSISLATKTMNNLKLKQIFNEAFSKIIEGKNFAQTISKYKIIPNDFVENMSAGENIGNVPKMLRIISELYNKENQIFIKTLLSIIEPVLMMFVGGAIGFIMIAMLLPIFSLTP